jgi:hypothetical protein
MPDSALILAGGGDRFVDVVRTRNDAIVCALKSRRFGVRVADHYIQAEVLGLLQAGDGLDSTAHN